ncbi:hypothetical protein DPEC_G00330420 [Dallia pectoralis]|uniref:Uncharacterized protein n=1 Tax=Dallia pectoralis TaxID=75939 RepID=A0ACC2F936_DALPE|nr:hypothetical protein DPEC_G00330420 [Dallia pectoralis]
MKESHLKCPNCHLTEGNPELGLECSSHSSGPEGSTEYTFQSSICSLAGEYFCRWSSAYHLQSVPDLSG